jgi:hypothetical protein
VSIRRKSVTFKEVLSSRTDMRSATGVMRDRNVDAAIFPLRAVCEKSQRQHLIF